MKERSSRFLGRTWWLVVLGVMCGSLSALLVAPFAVRAMPPIGWTHDHSAAGIPTRPHGYNRLVAVFGQPCNNAAGAARSSWPSQSTPGVDGYITYHPYIDRDVSWNIRNHIAADLKEQALYPGIGGYNCRYIEGTTSWSVHAFGAAIDTNWQRNPRGATTWNGVGADGKNYKKYLPNLWKGALSGPQLLLGTELQHDPRPHALPVRHRLLNGGSMRQRTISLAVGADGEHHRRRHGHRVRPGAARGRVCARASVDARIGHGRARLRSGGRRRRPNARRARREGSQAGVRGRGGRGVVRHVATEPGSGTAYVLDEPDRTPSSSRRPTGSSGWPSRARPPIRRGRPTGSSSGRSARACGSGPRSTVRPPRSPLPRAPSRCSRPCSRPRTRWWPSSASPSRGSTGPRTKGSTTCGDSTCGRVTGAASRRSAPPATGCSRSGPRSCATTARSSSSWSAACPRRSGRRRSSSGA